MVFGYFTLFVALVISAVAAYYSIVGLTSIFAAAVTPIIIMGAALEVGKVTAAVWLKLNWARARWTYKLYLVPAVAFLMVLTSMGIFGFLSKAHSDQGLVSGDVIAKIAIYDEKIKISKENIDANRRALKQMDEAVDQIMGRSTTETGAERSVQIRRQQGPERKRLIAEIEAEQKKISALNEERAPIASEVRKVEAEVGPIKYVAALIYGDNPDANLLERAVRWVIILIVAVFDPLALVLILAAQQSLRWAKEEKELARQEKIAQEELSREIENDPELNEFFEPPKETVSVTDKQELAPNVVIENNNIDFNTHSYLKQGFGKKRHPPGVEPVPPQVYQPPAEPIIESNVQLAAPEEKTIPKYVLKEAGYVEVDGKLLHERVLPDCYPEVLNDIEQRRLNSMLAPQADNEILPDATSRATFGTEFPANPVKGEMFLNVATLPSKLYKFNGSKWISVDKDRTDSYTYNEEYLQFLSTQIASGAISVDDLTVGEQEQIEQYLSKNVK